MKVLEQIGETLQVTYFVFDGAFGHHEALRMVRQTGLHLISKLQYNSALYLPYTAGTQVEGLAASMVRSSIIRTYHPSS